MTLCNLAPSVRALLRPAAWSRACEAGPSRLPATQQQLPRRAFQSGSAIRSPGQDDTDASTSNNGSLATQTPRDASAETSEAHSVSEKAQATREARDPYSLSEDFLRDAAEENALHGKLQNGGGLEYTYNRDDGDGEQSRRWLDALTEAYVHFSPFDDCGLTRLSFVVYLTHQWHPVLEQCDLHPHLGISHPLKILLHIFRMAPSSPDSPQHGMSPSRSPPDHPVSPRVSIKRTSGCRV